MQVGFICPMTDQNVTLEEHCVKCQVECEPLPLLAAMMDSVRAVEKDVYSATELLKPRQCLYLERNHPYYKSPDSSLWSIYGTALHSVIEKGLDKYNEPLFKNRYVYEKQFRIKINGATLRGTPDLYDTQTKTLWDWKTVKYYFTGKYLIDQKWYESTYMEQLNIYRTFFFPEAEHLKLKLLVRDHNYRLKKECPRPSVTVTVPILDDNEIKKFVSRRMKESVADQIFGNPPPCEEKDLWNGARCKDYCGGKEFCNQYKEVQNESIT